MSAVTDFLSGARDLARNPLGIIALFIAFIYGLATLLIGVSGEKLTEAERFPIIWFIVLFPLVVLGTFYSLVTKHHGKLYAPSDYREDKSFLNTLQQQTADMIARGVNEEVEIVAQTDTAPTAEQESTLAPAERQTTTEAKESAAAIDSADASVRRHDIRAQVVDAERLALAKVEKDLGRTLMKEVVFAGPPELTFDAATITPEELLLLEVKFVRTGIPSSALFREIVYRALLVKQAMKTDRKLRLILVVVYAIQEPARVQILERRVKAVAEQSPIAVEVRLYGINELRNEFPSLGH